MHADIPKIGSLFCVLQSYSKSGPPIFVAIFTTVGAIRPHLFHFSVSYRMGRRLPGHITYPFKTTTFNDDDGWVDQYSISGRVAQLSSWFDKKSPISCRAMLLSREQQNLVTAKIATFQRGAELFIVELLLLLLLLLAEHIFGRLWY
jgi:hypothetical protein